MPEKTIKRRLEEIDGQLADDDSPIFSTVAKLVKSLRRAIPESHDLEAKREALRLGRGCCAERSTRKRREEHAMETIAVHDAFSSTEGQCQFS
jgi:hypothetical protein